MRKTAASLLIVLLPAVSAGCSKSANTGGEQSGVSPREIPVFAAPADQPQPTLGMGKTSAEQRNKGIPDKTYFGETTTSGPGYLNYDSTVGTVGGYTNEKESVNDMLQQAKPKPAVSDQPAVKEPPPEQPLESKFLMARLQPLSPFSADVDTASYSNLRRYLRESTLPPANMVRVEEMINYFQYDLPNPKAGEPFSVTTELSECPWSEQSHLLRVAIKTKELDRGDTPPRNLVFLLDVSGSMNSSDKLPLLKRSLRKLVDNLDDSDSVSIVVYAGDSGVVLPPTSGDQKTVILEAIEQLRSGGSTNGSSGIQLAYELAEQTMDDRSINRVILATDGDFNVGISSRDALKKLIEEKRESGIFLSVLGFGRHGNDKVMETLADNGNGNYASIDSVNEAQKVLVEEAGATLVTVAKDVKFQVAFDPAQVESYRLIGYDNRRLAARDFDDDTKDAGEVGAGHSVTALYELKLAAEDPDMRILEKTDLVDSGTLATVKIRYKRPDEDQSILMESPVARSSNALSESSPDHQWATAVAGFGWRVKGELSAEQLSTEKIAELLQPVMKSEPDAYQAEFYSLVKMGGSLLK